MEFKAVLKSYSKASPCRSPPPQLISGYSSSTHLLIKSLWFESTFKSWLKYITFSASGIALEFLCLNTPLARPRMWVYAGKIPRDGPFVYQRCLAQARVIEGRMPNIGSPVTQPHLPPGSQSPSHHLALLPRPVLEMAMLSLMKWGSRLKWGTVWGFWRG